MAFDLEGRVLGVRIGHVIKRFAFSLTHLSRVKVKSRFVVVS